MQCKVFCTSELSDQLHCVWSEIVQVYEKEGLLGYNDGGREHCLGPLTGVHLRSGDWKHHIIFTFFLTHQTTRGSICIHYDLLSFVQNFPLIR